MRCPANVAGVEKTLFLIFLSAAKVNFLSCKTRISFEGIVIFDLDSNL